MWQFMWQNPHQKPIGESGQRVSGSPLHNSCSFSLSLEFFQNKQFFFKGLILLGYVLVNKASACIKHLAVLLGIHKDE